MTGQTALDAALADLADLPAGDAADAARADQDRRWADGERVPAEAYLAALPAVAADAELAMILIYGEVLARTARGETPAPAEYQARFPQWAERLAVQFQLHSALGRASSPSLGSDSTRPIDDTRPPDSTGPFLPQRAEVEPPPAPDGGRYRLGTELARGGMGVVYRAEDTVLKREVAVKVLSARLRGTDAARRFAVEAEITAGLQHPSIPPVHDLGTLPDGRPFLAMKLIKGETLAKKLAAKSPEDRDAHLAVFEQICVAVAFAHSRRVLHRDLKPANVMVGAFNEVQVMDWGLAKVLGRPDVLGDATAGEAADDWAGAEERTRAGQVMGTPSYMPPEQARAELYRIDERADVFALGGILCAILTGRAPYTGKNGQDVWRKAAAAELGEAFAALAAVEGMARYKRIAVRCLDPDPAKRYSHAGEVAAAAHDARTTAERARRRDELYEATDSSDRAERRERWRRRWWQVAGSLGLAFGVAAIWLGGWVNDYRDYYDNRTKLIAGYRGSYLALVVELTAREVDAGTFRKGGDARRRIEAEDRIRVLTASEHKQDVAFGCVLLAGIRDAADRPAEGDDYWSSAVKVSPEPPDVTRTVALCLDVMREFGRRKPPTALDKAVLRRVAQALRTARLEDYSEWRQAEIAAALAKADKLVEAK